MNKPRPRLSYLSQPAQLSYLLCLQCVSVLSPFLGLTPIQLVLQGNFQGARYYKESRGYCSSSRS
jgi:hypothetical protein